MLRRSKSRTRSYSRSPSPDYGPSRRYAEDSEEYPDVIEIAPKYSATPSSSRGKNYAPAGLERTIYRGSERRRAEDYVRASDSDSIKTRRPGDFHLNRDAAYFTYNKDYARECAGGSGAVIEQRIPREFLMDSYRFEEAPDEDWYTFVESNRLREIAPGKMRPVQKRNIIEGPIAESSNHKFRSRPVPREVFKPVYEDGEYVKQVAFLGDALEELTIYPKRIVSRSPPRSRR